MRKLADALLAVFAASLRAADLESAVAQAPVRVPSRAREVGVLAIGKAAPAMARGAMEALGKSRERLSRALVVAPDGTDVRGLDARFEVVFAPHPDPDRRSVQAARRARALVEAGDFTLALVSGGASSLVCEPQGLTLARYVRVVRALLGSGADVRAVNVVRRHLCAAKGGGLVRGARGRVETLIASDVVRGALHDVGSGPTVPDPTRRADAGAVLRRYLPTLRPLPSLHESLEPSAPVSRRLHARIVRGPEDLARAAVEALRARSFVVRRLPPSTADVAALARRYVAIAASLRPGDAVVRAAEPSVTVAARSPGRGGRSTHLAALVAGDLPPDVVFLAGASDGIDGSSGTGGAVVDRSLVDRAGPERVARALLDFDSGPLVASVGMSIASGPTGHNLADLHILARRR